MSGRGKAKAFHRAGNAAPKLFAPLRICPKSGESIHPSTTPGCPDCLLAMAAPRCAGLCEPCYDVAYGVVPF